MMIDEASINIALTQYIQTIPNESRLHAYLNGIDCDQHVEMNLEIKKELRALVNDVDQFLWAQQGGVTWTDAFEVLMFEHIQSQHTWLNRDAFKNVVAYSKWLCWHEGLGA